MVFYPHKGTISPEQEHLVRGLFDRIHKIHRMRLQKAYAFITSITENISLMRVSSIGNDKILLILLILSSAAGIMQRFTP